MVRKIHILFCVELKAYCVSENQITLKLMPEIKDPELKELIPNIKERIMYKVGLEKLQNVIHVSTQVYLSIFIASVF